MLRIKVNLPEDMTEVYKRINNFKADLIVEECKKSNVNVGVVIKYLENSKEFYRKK